MIQQSSLYTGKIVHTRLSPHRHNFIYKIFMVYLDLDEAESLFSKCRFWSYKKKNLASFYPNDFHNRSEKINSAQDLKKAVLNTVREKSGLDLSGPVRMLTHLRYFGLIFNPVTFYYCFDQNNKLAAIMAEIENTPWGERYTYVMDLAAPENQALLSPEEKARFSWFFKKSFHVSPFFPMNMNYRWTFSLPENQLSISMNSLQEIKQSFSANLALTKQPSEPSHFDLMILRYPFITLKVICGIYLQALLLLLKKTPFYSHPDSATQLSLIQLIKRKFSNARKN